MSQEKYFLNKEYHNRCSQLLKDLFPIYRTILGKGYAASLDIIKGIIPIKILKFPSGVKCGSWTIPKEWSVKSAYIRNIKKEIIIDFKDNGFHLWQYSSPFKGIISRDELLNHILVGSVKGVIPLSVTYYKDNWGFSLTPQQYEQLKDDHYEVDIDSEFKSGELLVGEIFLPGRSKQEILIDAVLSCPALGNNLSGVVVAVFLAELISKLENRFFSYRILFTPETIGPIALHYLYKGFGKNIVGGYNLSNLAKGADFYYKKSRLGQTVADQAMLHSLKFLGFGYRTEDYNVLSGTCGNEKAYNSLGIEIPLGALRRLPFGSYPEYDTSADNLSFVDDNLMFDSLVVLWNTVQVLEKNKKYKHTFEGEPFLTGYGLFPKITTNIGRLPYDCLMGFADGKLNLVEIAEKAGLFISDFDEPLKLMLEKGLIKEMI